MRFRQFLQAVALVLAASGAQAAPASVESVERMLVAMKADAMLDIVVDSMERDLRQKFRQLGQKQTLTPEQQRVVDLMPAKLAALMRAEMRDTLRPLTIQIYTASFEQEEVDALITFFTSPVGQSYLSKMPAVLQQYTVAVDSILKRLLPKIDGVMRQSLAEANISM